MNQENYQGWEIDEKGERKALSAELIESLVKQKCCEEMTLTKTCDYAETFCLIYECDRCDYYLQSLELKNTNEKEHPFLYLKEGGIDFKRVDVDRFFKANYDVDEPNYYKCTFEGDDFDEELYEKDLARKSKYERMAKEKTEAEKGEKKNN